MHTISQIEYFKKEILNIINNSGLSIDIGYYVMKDILNEIHLIYLETLNNEQNNKTSYVEEEEFFANPEEGEEKTVSYEDFMKLQAAEQELQKKEIKEEE
jgi:hypothetical protein